MFVTLLNPVVLDQASAISNLKWSLKDEPSEQDCKYNALIGTRFLCRYFPHDQIIDLVRYDYLEPVHSLSCAAIPGHMPGNEHMQCTHLNSKFNIRHPRYAWHAVTAEETWRHKVDIIQCNSSLPWWTTGQTFTLAAICCCWFYRTSCFRRSSALAHLSSTQINTSQSGKVPGFRHPQKSLACRVLLQGTSQHVCWRPGNISPGGQAHGSQGDCTSTGGDHPCCWLVIENVT